MTTILHIDTALNHAGTCITRGDEVLAIKESHEQKNHASFLQPAIEKLLADTGLSLSQMDAIAVSAGPGSYTGLRVGLASAKGICFALQKPLIMVNTLEVLAQSLISHFAKMKITPEQNSLICPLIDARRMEVFTAMYTLNMKEIEAAHALVVNAGSFDSYLAKGVTYFCGNGTNKCLPLLTHGNARPEKVTHSAADLAKRALIAYQSNRFADLAYAEPFYVKEFFDASQSG